MATMKRNEKKSTGDILQQMATESADPVAKDLLSIRWHSKSLFAGICQIVNAIEIQRKQGFDLGRSEELLNELVGELADSFRQFDSESVIDDCMTYADKVRKMLQTE